MIDRVRAQVHPATADRHRSSTTSAARIGAWLQPTEVVFAVDGRVPDDVLRVASIAFARRHDLTEALVFDALVRRERAGSTALGRGFAVPHARVAGVAAPSTLFVRALVPIAFGASDGIPTTDFLFILVPADGNNDEHLEMLSAVASLFSDRRFCRRLRRDGDPDDVAEVFRRAIARWVARFRQHD